MNEHHISYRHEKPKEVMISLKDMICPNCKSFQIWTTHGDVKGRSVMDGWRFLEMPMTIEQRFTTRSWHQDECRSCGHKWNYKEHDGITLVMEARKPTLMDRIREVFK